MPHCRCNRQSGVLRQRADPVKRRAVLLSWRGRNRQQHRSAPFLRLFLGTAQPGTGGPEGRCRLIQPTTIRALQASRHARKTRRTGDPAPAGHRPVTARLSASSTLSKRLPASLPVPGRSPLCSRIRAKRGTSPDHPHCPHPHNRCRGRICAAPDVPILQSPHAKTWLDKPGIVTAAGQATAGRNLLAFAREWLHSDKSALHPTLRHFARPPSRNPPPLPAPLIGMAHGISPANRRACQTGH